MKPGNDILEPETVGTELFLPGKIYHYPVLCASGG